MVGDHLSQEGFYDEQHVISAAMQMIQVVSSVCIVANFYVIETTCFARQVTLQWFILLKIPSTWDDQIYGLLPPFHFLDSLFFSFNCLHMLGNAASEHFDEKNFRKEQAPSPCPNPPYKLYYCYMWSSIAKPCLSYLECLTLALYLTMPLRC